MNSHRPFQILGIQQIAVGAADKHRLRTFWIDLLGLEYHKTFISETENVDEDICIIGSGDFAVEVDLMEPLDNTVKPRVDLPALNHVGLWVDDLSAAAPWRIPPGVKRKP